MRFEGAAAPVELSHDGTPAGGTQPVRAFWEMLGETAQPLVPPNPAYDKDYGVGTTPTIPPPEVVVSMPTISAPMSMSGTASLVPGVHTTAEDEDAPNAPPETPRGDAPPMSMRLPGTGVSAAEVPPPTPRGGGAFESLPRPTEPLPTPRGRPAPDTGIPDASEEHKSKKARDESEEAATADGGAPGPFEGGKAELYAYDAEEDIWSDPLDTFERDDLDDEGSFALVVYDAAGAARRVELWVGGDSKLSYERDSDIIAVGKAFAESIGGGGMPVSLVFQGEETDDFWAFF